jgi:hypothetical protein
MARNPGMGHIVCIVLSWHGAGRTAATKAGGGRECGHRRFVTSPVAAECFFAARRGNHARKFVASGPQEKTC